MQFAAIDPVPQKRPSSPATAPSRLLIEHENTRMQLALP
jgi:hypothetical protein